MDDDDDEEEEEEECEEEEEEEDEQDEQEGEEGDKEQGLEGEYDILPPPPLNILNEQTNTLFFDMDENIVTNTRLAYKISYLFIFFLKSIVFFSKFSRCFVR